MPVLQLKTAALAAVFVEFTHVIRAIHVNRAVDRQKRHQLFMESPSRSITAFSDWKVLRMNWVYSSVPM